MPQNDAPPFWSVLVFVLIVGGIMFALGYTAGIQQARNDAIAAGVAEYVVDPKTGAAEFRYHKSPPEKSN